MSLHQSVANVGSLVFREKITLVKLTAIGIAGAGLAIYAGTASMTAVVMLAGFASGVSDGVSHGLRKSLGAFDVPRTIQLQYQYIVGILIMIIVMLASGETIIRVVSVEAMLATVLFAMLLIAVGNLMLYGFKHFDVNVGAIILASEIFFASLLAYIFYGELPSIREGIGILLIFVAAVMSTLDIRALMARWRPSDVPVES